VTIWINDAAKGHDRQATNAATPQHSYSADLGASSAPIADELEAAKAAGAFLLLIGCTGGMAKSVCERLVGSELASDGVMAMRPTDDELVALMETRTP